ncbi:MAG TPA: DUF1574 family protein [Syntrophorhabdaceae bacterium]|jgi:hypothetical protein
MPQSKVISHAKWLKSFACFVLCSIAIICLFNYAVDSVGIFRTDSGLLFAAKALTRGLIVAGFRNMDERQFQELIIENDERKLDTIVLGSSRSMEFRGHLFKKDLNDYFFNHSVSGASLEDHIAIIGIYKNKKGYIPKRIIIGVDPWIFNKNAGQNRWQSIGAYYEAIIKDIYGKKIKVVASSSGVKYKQLVTWDYTIANIKALLMPSKRNRFYIVETVNTDDSLRASDGSNYYPYKTRFKEQNEVEKDAKAYAKSPVYSLEKFCELSNVQLFEDFIQYLQKNGAEVILFLPPYHPVTYDLLVNKNEYKILADVEKYLKNYSIHNNLRLIGSYDAKQHKLGNEDFFDGMHSRDVVVERLFSDQKVQHSFP